MLRLILGVLAGFVFSILGIVGTEMLMLKLLSRGGGGVPIVPEGQIIAMELGLSTLVGLLGGALAVLIAKGREWTAGGGLAALRLLAFAASAQSVMDKQPAWFLITLLLIGIVTALLAAWIATARQKRQAKARADSADRQTLSTA